MQAGTVHMCGNGARPSSRKFLITIPKILACSQLPVGTTYPLEVTLTVCEGGSEGGSTGELANQSLTSSPGRFFGTAMRKGYHDI